MSSISNDASEAQKVRDYYKEREKTLKEQHRKEISKMQNAHQVDVQKINSNTDERINRASQETQSTIERRDMRHQREMQKLRNIHSEQRKRESLDRMKTEEHLNDTYQDQLRSQDKVHRAQMQNVTEKSSQNLSNNNEKTGEILAQYQKRQQEESQVSRDRLNRVHQQEKREQQIRHRDEMDSVVHKTEGVKQNKEQQIDTLKQKHRFELEALNRRHEIAMQDQKYQEAETLKDVREEYGLGIKKVQDKYDKALMREKQQLAVTQEKVYGQQGQVNQERDRQNQKIRTLRDDNARDHARMGAQKRRELENVKIADQHAYDKLYEQRRLEHKQANQIHGEELALAKSSADQRVKANYEFFDKKMEIQEDRNNRLLTDQRRKLITENNDKRKDNEMHLNQLQENYANDQEKLTIAHKNEQIRLQDRYQTNLEKNRFQDESQRDQMRASFEEKIKEMDLRYKNDLMDLKQQHDRKIISMRDRQQQQIVDMKRENERLQMEKDKAYASREVQREARFRHTVKNMETQHAEQLKIMDSNYKQNMTRFINQSKGPSNQKA